MNLRYKALLEETEMLRGFAAAAPWPVWAKRANGALSFANPAYAQATEAASVADAINRNLELLDSADRARHGPRAARQRRLRRAAADRGRRRAPDLRRACAQCSAAAAPASPSTPARPTALRAALVRMAEAHRRTLDQLSSGVAVFDAQRRLAFYNDSYRRLWDLDRAFLDGNPDDSSVLDRLRAARKIAGAAGFPRLEGQAARGLSRGRSRKRHLVSAGRPRAPRRHHAESGRRRHLSVRRRHRKPRPGAAVRRPDPRAARDARQSRRSRRGVRQQRPRATVQSGFRQDVEAVGRKRCASSRISRPSKPGAGRCSTTQLTWQTLREAITGIDNRTSVALKLERKDGSVLDCMTMPLPDGATMLTFQDVTDTENVERALRERNEALETADQMKVDFVHHVSYELRSPLTTIIGFAHFLSDPSTGPLTPKQAEYLGYITSSTNALLAIINNILDLATIDAGAMTLESRPGRCPQDHRGRRRRHSGPARHRPHPARGRRRSQHRQLRRRRAPRGAGALQSARQCRRLLAAGRHRRPERAAHRTQRDLHRDRFRPGHSARRQGQGVRLVRKPFQRLAASRRRPRPVAGALLRRTAWRQGARQFDRRHRARPSPATSRPTRPRIATPPNDRIPPHSRWRWRTRPRPRI